MYVELVDSCLKVTPETTQTCFESIYVELVDLCLKMALNRPQNVLGRCMSRWFVMFWKWHEYDMFVS